MSALFFSCSKSDDNNMDCDWVEETSEISQKVINASIAYSQDATPDNCEKYKQTLNEYINALERFRGCYKDSPGTIQANYEQIIKLNQESVNDLNCQ